MVRLMLDWLRPHPRISRLLMTIMVLITIGTTVGYFHILKPKMKINKANANVVPTFDSLPQSPPSVGAYLDPVEEWEIMTFMIFLENTTRTESLENIRNFIGSFQRFRSANNRGPQFYILTWQPLEVKVQEEISLWNRVHIQHIGQFLGIALMDLRPGDYNEDKSNGIEDEDGSTKKRRKQWVIKLALNQLLSLGHDMVLYVDVNRRQVIFDPRGQELNAALQKMSAELISNSINKCRLLANQLSYTVKELGALHETYQDELVILAYYKNNPLFEQTLPKEIECLFDKSPSISDENNELDSENNKGDLVQMETGACAKVKQPIVVKMTDLGFNIISDPKQQREQKVSSSCLLDIRAEPFMNDLVMGEMDGDPQGPTVANSLVNTKKRILVIGLPTTAKGMRMGAEPVFLRVLLPSIIKTVSDKELAQWTIMIYIGFDHLDSVWDVAEMRRRIRNRAQSLIGNRPIGLRMFRLPNTRRVAMLWSFLYTRAIRDGADYFYQVNDDLTLITPNWLTNFTTTLDQNRGFGVVGPSDEFNGFKCQVLTQSMIGRTHFHIFHTLYPVEMKDWKTDRWLTWIYGPEHTHCWPTLIANNGASSTRYNHCDYLAWWLLVERARRQINNWRQERDLAPVVYPSSYKFIKE